MGSVLTEQADHSDSYLGLKIDGNCEWLFHRIESPLEVTTISSTAEGWTCEECMGPASREASAEPALPGEGVEVSRCDRANAKHEGNAAQAPETGEGKTAESRVMGAKLAPSSPASEEWVPLSVRQAQAREREMKAAAESEAADKVAAAAAAAAAAVAPESLPLSVRLGLRTIPAFARPAPAAAPATAAAAAPQPNSEPEWVPLSVRQAQAREREMKAAAEAKSEEKAAEKAATEAASAEAVPPESLPLSVRLGLRPKPAAAPANTTAAPAPKPNSEPEWVPLSMRQAQAREREMKAAAEAKSEEKAAEKAAAAAAPGSLPLSVRLGLRPKPVAAPAKAAAPALEPKAEAEWVPLSMRQAQARDREMKAAAEDEAADSCSSAAAVPTESLPLSVRLGLRPIPASADAALAPKPQEVVVADDESHTITIPEENPPIKNWSRWKTKSEQRAKVVEHIRSKARSTANRIMREMKKQQLALLFDNYCKVAAEIAHTSESFRRTSGWKIETSVGSMPASGGVQAQAQARRVAPEQLLEDDGEDSGEDSAQAPAPMLKRVNSWDLLDKIRNTTSIMDAGLEDANPDSDDDNAAIQMAMFACEQLRNAQGGGAGPAAPEPGGEFDYVPLSVRRALKHFKAPD
jgi:hypothetical protein